MFCDDYMNLEPDYKWGCCSVHSDSPVGPDCTVFAYSSPYSWHRLCC